MYFLNLNPANPEESVDKNSIDVVSAVVALETNIHNFAPVFRIMIHMYLGLWIRIRIRDLFLRICIRIRIFPFTKANEEKPWFLLFCDFILTSYLWRMM